jgi:hypothetical protein
VCFALLTTAAATSDALSTCVTENPYPSCSSSFAVPAGQCWQQTLTSTRRVDDPYRIKLKATFKKSGVVKWTTYAFWDGSVAGGDNFVIRASFPQPPVGSSSHVYTWSMTCESGDCAGVGLTPGTPGSVTINRYSGTNELYLRGFLKATPSGSTTPPIQYGDGTSFLWHGDTAWAALMRACRYDWRAYVDNRRDNRFTVIQLGLAPSWGGPTSTEYGPESIRGVTPFQDRDNPHNPLCDPGTAPSAIPDLCMRWNPTFWRELDGMVQYANSQGLVVFLVGLAKPVHDDPFPQQSEAENFARQLVGRMAGNYVVFSPGFDDGASSSTQTLLSQVGTEISNDSSRHLVTVHPGTNTSVTQGNLATTFVFHTSSWLDFEMYQSGHNAGNLLKLTRRPFWMAQELRGFTSVPPFNTTRKPAINGEAIYDHGGSPTASPPYHWNHFRARQAGYTSWFSGATGYTIGVGGLQEWGLCGDEGSPAFAQCNPDAPMLTGYRNWSDAIHRRPTQEMRWMGDAIRLLQWPTMVTNEQWRIVTAQSSSSTELMTTTRDPNYFVVFMPFNSSVEVDLSGLNVSPTDARGMFNPRDGFEYSAFTMVANPSGTYTYSRPTTPPGICAGLGECDFVLVLRKPATAYAATDGSKLEVWASPGIAGIDEAPGIFGQVVAADTRAPSEPFRLSDVDSGLVANPDAVGLEDGSFVVAWEERDEQGGAAKVMLREVTAAGVLPGRPFALEPASEGSQLSPALAATPGGGFIGVWEELIPSEDSSSSSVLAQRYSPALSPSGKTVQLAHSDGQRLRSPKATCSRSGDCWSGWQAGTRQGTVEVHAVKLNESGEIAAGEIRVNDQSRSEIWLLGAEGLPDGGVRFQWEAFDAARNSVGRREKDLSPNGLARSAERPAQPAEGGS